MFFTQEIVMRYRRYKSRPTEFAVPRQICIVYNDGKVLHVIPFTWQSMYDFLKEPRSFALSSQEQELGTMPGAERFKERVWAKVGQGKNTVSVGNVLWGINDMPIEPASALRIVVTQNGPRAFRY